jgi:hypothetical protein
MQPAPPPVPVYCARPTLPDENMSSQLGHTSGTKRHAYADAEAPPAVRHQPMYLAHQPAPQYLPQP